MVPLITDVYANVVQQRTILEPVAFAITKAVNAPCLVEHRERQPGNLLRMLGPVPTSFAEFDDAAPAHVRVSLDFANRRAVAVNVIENQPFA